MIIPNGTIELKQKTGGGIDSTTGYPIASTTAWGNPIECQYLVNSRDNLGRASGEAFIRASYTILIEQQQLNSEQLRLTDEGGVVREFSIISVEQLDAVCQTKILV